MRSAPSWEWPESLLDLVGFALAGVIIVAPWWRHRVLVHRPPFDVYFALHDIILYTSDYALLFFLAAAWLVWIAVPDTRRRPFGVGPWFTAVPMAVLLALTAASTLWAVDAPYAGYQAVRLVLWYALYLALVNMRVPRLWLGLGAYAGASLQAVVALGQVALGRSLGLNRLGELTLNPLWPGISVVFTPGGRRLRAYGLTQHPNLLGGLLVVLVLLQLGWALADTQISHNRLARAGLPAASALSMAALLFTFSRGAWLAALVGGLCLCVLLARSKLRPWRASARVLAPYAMVGVLLAICFAATQWSLLRPRLGLEYQGGEVRSMDERATLLAGAKALREVRPWLGVGAGGFSTALYKLAPDAIAAYPTFQPVHRVPVLLAAELGPTASLAWLLLMVGPVCAVLLGPVGVRSDPWLAGLTGALVALFSASWWEAYPWASHQGMVTLWLVLGAWASAYGHARGCDRLPRSDDDG